VPELPEVEVLRQGLLPLVVGRTVMRIRISRKKLRRPVPRLKLKRWIIGRRLTDVTRRAKYLCLVMENRALLVIHLGMTGNLRILPADSPRKKHDHLGFLLDNGMEIRFNDTRRFGSIQVFSPEEAPYPSLFDGLGPEPFSDDFSPAYLLVRAEGHSQPVKNFLMDNHNVVGIGNIYANEILFAAGISPGAKVDTLSGEQWQQIITAGRCILEKAIACGGTTISDFVDASGKSGYFQLDLLVYGRNGHPCPNCQAPVQKAVQAGRPTFYCPVCQT